ncbi:uncharacterized protein LOC128170850 isoform X1 [Crassostrea angulata]|uniref:uncharacterized protein LOC128170850 isoform X1 n=1 Tax=Magallana angulata TaxID=2784310 RepID=UPI0022B1DBB7|nr:uncharacterized protein LOC128170850 isoform X1 [Crassostrea angulata]XP_052692563.1 uncharacterized protein LOC128170850 isoform X1 [Crassostrea angulata]XP_052692564.1 uncharacterized protein LOC128170850 isoform X1 [Crassostrea angulata]
MISQLHVFIFNVGSCINVKCFVGPSRQSRKIFVSSEGDQWKAAVTSIVQPVQGTNGNLSMLFRLAAYPDNIFAEIERIFNLWQEKHQQKEIPQLLFKNLGGLDNEIVLQYLHKIEKVESITKISKEIEKKKKHEVLRQIFVQRSGCGTWEEALDTYENVSENLEMFQGMNITKKYIPRSLIKFIDDTVAYRPSQQQENVRINIEVDIEENLLENSEIQKIIKDGNRKMEIEIKRIVKRMRES